MNPGNQGTCWAASEHDGQPEAGLDGAAEDRDPRQGHGDEEHECCTKLKSEKDTVRDMPP